MKTTLWSVTGMAAIACALSLSSCGPRADDSQTHVNVSTSDGANGTDTVVQQTTVVQQRTDTLVQQRVDTVVKRDVDTVVRRDTVHAPARPASSVTISEKAQIDVWLRAHADSLNQYGDSRNTVYAGATPLFNEGTGQRIDRYDYIVSKHPDRPWLATTPAQPRR